MPAPKNRRGLESREPRDQLFISYASEDLPFVRWLALKLSASGYRVWWDRESLLAGEQFPPAIDHVLKSLAFRVLAVLSLHSSYKFRRGRAGRG